MIKLDGPKVTSSQNGNNARMILIDEEFLDGHSFTFIDKERQSTYSSPIEVVLKVDHEAWTLCWEHARKRRKKIHYERRFVFVESIVDVRPNRDNLHEMVVVCNRNYTSYKFFTFISDPDAIKRWSGQLFQLAYSKKHQEDSSLGTINKLLYHFQPNEHNKKFKIELMYEQWMRPYDMMSKKLLKHKKRTSLPPNEEPIDTYLRYVSRPDLHEIFNNISDNGVTINAQQLTYFINETQCEFCFLFGNQTTGLFGCLGTNDPITQQEALELIQSLEPNQNEMSSRGFFKFMLGAKCDQFGVVRETEKGYYDKPLSHYYIKSSHNSYLKGTQISIAKNLPTSKHTVCQADVEMYRQILLSGYRCVELDCWDGPGNQPVVTHGPIILQRINILPLNDVCEAIIESAFKTSTLPVVLSLENHCSPEQQEVMMRTFLNVFGSHLLTDPLHDYPLTNLSELPPPSALQYKILLKGTRRRNRLEESKSSNPLDIFKKYDWREPQRTDVQAKRQQFRDQRSTGINDPKFKTIGVGIRGKVDQVFNGISNARTSSSLNDSYLPQQTSTDDDLDAESLLTVEMNSTLADLVNYFRSSRDLAFDDPVYVMHSAGEQKIDKSISLHGNAFIQHSSTHVVRVYPAAWRVDSSNISPLQYMMAGCQMICMNCQTPGLQMQFYDSFFVNHRGQTGIVAKPLTLLGKQPSGPYKAFRLEVKLLSAQFLELISQKCYEELCKVTVRVDLYDLPHNFIVNQWEVVSERSKNNFNTIFEPNTFVFDKIITPELAMLHFRVLDETGSKIGQRFVRIDQIKPGYRHLSLRNRFNKPEPAFLFARFNLAEYVPENQDEIRDLYMNPLRNQFNLEETRKTTHDLQLKLSGPMASWRSSMAESIRKISMKSHEFDGTNDSSLLYSSLPYSSQSCINSSTINNVPHIALTPEETSLHNHNRHAHLSANRSFNNVQNKKAPPIPPPPKLNKSRFYAD